MSELVAGSHTGDGQPDNHLLGTSVPECFVVMPFGTKPVPGTDQWFDFDKPYRVIMRRAIEAAGMSPIRADESIASGIIHTDMFKALRDRKVVLVELSLHNPNVYYELGIRHVLSTSGTVLMCRAGQPLPFDVALSRVVTYEYDGVHLDWEEAERVVPILRQHLLEALQGHQDSPVHALIHLPSLDVRTSSTEWTASRSSGLERYEQDLGERWHAQGQDVVALLDEHAGTTFGLRAIGYRCLVADPPPPGSAAVAERLVDAAQYDVANRLFERLGPEELSFRQRETYASSYSEEHGGLAGTDRAIAMVEAVITDVERAYAPSDQSRLAALAHAHRRLAGLRQWRFQRTASREDLDATIDALATTLQLMLESRRVGGDSPSGLVAQTRVKLMLHLRIRDRDPRRPDSEQHGPAVLASAVDPSVDDPLALSWLRWFQALVLADQGHERAVQDKVYEALREDALLASPEYVEVGARQYVLLRRFIDQYSEWFRDPVLIGSVAQALQSQLRS
jgi:hypothetical protein